MQLRKPLSPEAQAAEKVTHHIVNKFGSAATAVVSPGVNAPYFMVHSGKNSRDMDALPNGPETLFGIGSITKSIVAAIVIQLSTQYNFSLNSTLGSMLAQYEKTAWGSATIQQLLNMTSGIQDYLNGRDDIWPVLAKQRNHAWTPDELMTAFLQQYDYPTKFKPGNGYYYSNTGYIILAQLIEQLTGKSIEYNLNHFVEGLPFTGNAKMFFKPTVLANHTDAPYAPHLAHYYDMGDVSNKVNQSFYSACGGFVATAEAIFQWVDMLYTGKVLTPTQLQQMQQLISQNNGKPIRDVTPQDPYGYALGIAKMYIPGYGPSWCYQGQIDGSLAFYFRVPTANLGMVTIVFTVNSSELSENEVFVILDALLKARGAQPTNQATAKPEPKAKPEAQVADYTLVGFWKNTASCFGCAETEAEKPTVEAEDNSCIPQIKSFRC